MENLETELETRRQKVVSLTWKCVIPFIIIGVLIVVFSFISGKMLIPFVFIDFTIGLIVTLVVTNKPRKEFVKLYKDRVVGDAFSKIFEDVVYTPDRGIDRQVIANTQMMYMGDIYRSNDHISAKYKGISLEAADVDIQEQHTDSDGNTTYVTIFSGQWFIFDFNKAFKADLQVVDKHFGNAKRGGLFSKKKFNKVELEDIEFNKAFKVYAEHDEDAFYVLSPGTMEKIKTLRNGTKGKILLCFINNKLHVGLYNGLDMFEPKIFKKVNLQQEEEKVLGQIRIITNFVDTLNLDNDLFRREV